MGHLVREIDEALSDHHKMVCSLLEQDAKERTCSFDVDSSL